MLVCPECGSTASVLQSVTTSDFECRLELGGCGAKFDQPDVAAPTGMSLVHDAVRRMTDAIRGFEDRDFPLGRDSILEMQAATAELLDILKREVGRLTTAMSEESR